MKERLKNKIDQLNAVRQAIGTIPQVVNGVVESHKDVLLSLNRDQMLLGRNAKGEVLTPTYQEDPYFETKESADSYARMKYGLEKSHMLRLWANEQVYPNKSKDTPNLIVTGPFQNGMFITVNSDSFTIGSTFASSSDIDSKYHGVFGLAPKSVDYFWITFLRTELIKHLGL